MHAETPRIRGPMSASEAPHDDETRFLEMIFPEQANHYGVLYAGSALTLLTKAAFVTASRHVRGDVVMARSSGTDFHTPVHVGELLNIAAKVTRTGRTSMTVEVEGIAETLTDGTRRPALSGKFEMVAVDPAGKPVPLEANQSGDGA